MPEPTDPQFDVGRMRDRLLLQARPPGMPTGGLAGDELVSWADVGTYWAWLEPLSGRTLVNAMQVKSTMDHRVWIRQVAPISPLVHRFVFSGTTLLYPESVVRYLGRNEFFVILASSMQGEATS